MKKNRHKTNFYERRSQLYSDILNIPSEILGEEILSFSYGDFRDFFGVDVIVRAMASRLNEINPHQSREVMKEYHKRFREKERESKRILESLPYSSYFIVKTF